MTEFIIPPNLLNKLGHNILEIRQRALLTLLSKIDNGFLFEDDLAQSKEILTKLFEWFLFDPCPHKEMVLALIKRILLTNSGSILINHYGPNTIKKELKQVQECLEPEYHSAVDELFEIVDAFKEGKELIPPLVSDMPLSYRSEQSYKSNKTNIETTATSFSGYISKGPSIEPQIENPNTSNYTTKETFTVNRELIAEVHTSHNIEDVLPNYYFPWQPLIDADMQVLDSVENSLKNPMQSSELICSCEFFSDVLLHDFPAEIFLQRPSIILLLQNLLYSATSTRLGLSILNCFTHLTKSLLRRIDYCNDPCMRSLKEYTSSYSESSTPNTTNCLLNDIVNFKEDFKSLKSFEISTIKYCLTTLKCSVDYSIIKPESLRDTSKKKHLNLYNATILIKQLLYLLKKCFSHQIWNVQPHGAFYDTLKHLHDCMISFGELLENYRIELSTNRSNAKLRALHLCILHECVYLLENFIPLDKCIHILPKSLKNSLALSLLDIPMAKLYPELHSKILNYVKTFSGSDNSESLNKFECVKEICDSMTAAVEFMRSYHSSSFSTLMTLANIGVLSLQFHENVSFVDMVIEICATKFSLHTIEMDALKMENVVLSLLSHKMHEYAEYTYELCHKKVISAIGPTLNFTGSGISSAQVVFLLRTKILTEIMTYGLANENREIKKNAEDIIIHLIKCKILVTEDIWNKVIEALIPSLPILLIYATKLTPLGRTIINVVDPDIAKDLKLSTLDVFKSNILLLFSPEDLVRDEAFCRLCWILSTQDNSKNLLPRLNNINDKSLSNICYISPKSYDINKSRSVDRFYQPSSLHHVMELLDSVNVEPAIRRSALTQISVMMEDYLLHDIFLEKGGVQTVLKIMNSALVEADYKNYADSVIPAVAILKNICIYSSKTCFELSHDLNLFQCILRGMFLFCTEERLKIDASVLLFFLLYNSYIQGTPSTGNMAIPKLVYDKMLTPVVCGTFGGISNHTKDDITHFILSDKSCLASIQMHWNSEVYGGFKELTQLENLREPSDIKITEQLKIQKENLDQIKVSSIHFSIEECLKEMQNGENCVEVEEVLDALMIYVFLYDLSKKEGGISLISYSWEESFGKYLRILPSSGEDACLLLKVIKFLRVLIPFYKLEACWILSVLKNPTQYITELIVVESSSDEYLKLLSKELINLITDCVCLEQKFINFYIESDQISQPNNSWAGIIEMITDNLRFQDPQQLYNLAYLNSSLSCLVHLSSLLGWSSARRKNSPKQTMKEIISGLCDLVDAFHYGKGPISAISLMGLSITRNVLLILNHMVAEMLNANIKNWDMLFSEDISEHNKIFNFVILWNTRDVVLRAAVLQFFAGLVKSLRLSRDIISNLKKKDKCLWSMALNILLDNEEASIVRENAALILANLCMHRVISTNNIPTLHNEISPLNINENSSSPVANVLELINQNKGMKHLKTLILCLYTINISDSLKTHEIPELTSKSSGYLYSYRTSSDISERSWSSNDKDSNGRMNISTPSLVKSTVLFLHNLIELTEKSFVDYLNDEGLMKLIFRSICHPFIELRNTKELTLYIELLQMHSEICFFLNRSIRVSPACLGTILHTKDCFNILISLLNPKAYHTHLPQLLFLRNKLWMEIFSLITVFLECGCQIQDSKRAFEILGIILETVYNCNPVHFIATITEAIGKFGSIELQESVLMALTLMLQIECSYQLLAKNIEMKNSITMKHSMQNLLDTIKAPKSMEMGKKIDFYDAENSTKSTNNISKYKMNLLEQIYFGEAAAKISQTRESTEIEPPVRKTKILFSGAEICRLLLHLYDIYDLNAGKEISQKQIIMAATSSILCVSTEAKYFALDSGFLQKIIENLKELSIKLSLESIDCFRRMGDKKRISPLLKDLDSITGLITNFLLDNISVKCEAASLGLADIIHKVWNWFDLQKVSSINVLKMLSTFTTNCPFACQSLPYTSPVAGTGPRKSASSLSLLHVLVEKISREMDMLSKTHDILPLRLCFNILSNSSSVLECRVCITKSNLFQGLNKLHPALTKRQKPWEMVELIWLEYLQVFTVYPEGQMYLGKLPDVLDLIIILTQSLKEKNRRAALTILQNIAFYTPNRTRLLTTPNFISTLREKLESGSNREKIIVINTIWALAANNMKAKTVLKSARLDTKLNEALKKIQILNDNSVSEEEILRMQYVSKILRDSEKCK
ncbi:hypothetical protein HHI36_014889 [Cryptolaemus montrouzieri]|uniref:Rotatin N-terminal domain-containing protein n=1 Tax=Cryptolaemus montrouzieri TaxID=559131 RepID=A0ABD2N440_9CUCU